MSTPEQPSEAVKKVAFEKVCQVRIYQLFQLAEVLNLASARGAFRGNELSHVGALFDTLTKAVDQAFKMAKEEVESPLEVPQVTNPVAKLATGMKNVKIADDVTKV